MKTSAAPPPLPLQLKHSRSCSFVLVLPPVSRPYGSSSSFSSNSLRRFPGLRVLCSGGNGSGNVDSKSVLDAFFLGKALAEAVTERIESAVGEFLSTFGRIQAEQQKQVQDLQDEVLQRARKAKGEATLQALEVEGLIPKPTVTPAENGSPVVSPPSTDTASDGDLFQDMMEV
ncbi:uncharacterized protein At4g13200, chloroplastic isoform X2 [Aristolochia californica]|uniref:uncharacterized protein At4g13200, chloroplastic isoform X2 n=1 Tax=Aristolochia californica TaxID=171875 RepID=UPI0035D788FE